MISQKLAAVRGLRKSKTDLFFEATFCYDSSPLAGDTLARGARDGGLGQTFRLDRNGTTVLVVLWRFYQATLLSSCSRRPRKSALSRGTVLDSPPDHPRGLSRLSSRIVAQSPHPPSPLATNGTDQSRPRPHAFWPCPGEEEARDASALPPCRLRAHRIRGAYLRPCHPGAAVRWGCLRPRSQRPCAVLPASRCHVRDAAAAGPASISAGPAAAESAARADGRQQSLSAGHAGDAETALRSAREKRAAGG